MRIVLVWPPIRLPRVFAHYPTFSALGLLANAAYLRDRGYEVKVVDALTLPGRLNLRPDGGDFRHVGAEVDEVAGAVEAALAGAGGPAVVVVAVTMFSELNRPHETLVPATAAAIRRRLPDVPLGLADFHIGGMNYFPYEPARALAATPAADWIAVGEGETTLPSLFERLARGEHPAGLPRIAARAAGGELAWNPADPGPLPELDGISPPAFDLLDMDRWFAVQADAIRAELVHEYHVVERQLPLMTSRSCPYQCSFCTNQVLALPWRAHSVEWLRRAVTELRDRYRIDRFMFLDDNINVDARRFRELVAWLGEQRIAWDAVNGYRADLLDAEAVRAIKAAGNTKITVSAESGDPEILRDLIGKKLKLSKVVDIARICEAERVPLQVHYILGVPGETKTQMNRTLEFATMLYQQHGAWPLLQHAIPFPGTQLFQDCERHGWFVAPPFDIPGDVLEKESIIRTPEFQPGEVMRMKWNAQRLLAAMRQAAWIEVDGGGAAGCLACPATDAAAAPTAEEVAAAADRARFLGATELFLGGADPSLRADLPELVRDARARGFTGIALVGHGRGLAGAHGDGLFAAGLDRLVLDLHGPDAATHDAVAGAPGAFADAVAAARRAVAAGVAVELRAAATRRNLARLAETTRFAAALGARKLTVELPAPDTGAAAAGEISPWPEAKAALLRAVAAGPRGFATLQGVPFCLVREAPAAVTPAPPWVLERTRRLKAKHRGCLECPGRVLCGGFYASEHEAAYRMMPPGDG